MEKLPLNLVAGRGSCINPPNGFSRLRVEPDPEFAGETSVPTGYFEDNSQSVVTENDSPDVPFRFSINPYRGCLHGCSYCFARPSHEYLDLSAGLDFETKIFVKRNAPDLFRQWLFRRNAEPEPVVLSGVTDCYQPVEKQFRITRGCLEAALEARQPVSIITKNALVLRDRDLLAELAKRNLVRVNLSVTTLEQSLVKVMEPRTSAPAARLRAIRELTAAGVPVAVLVAPVIPGLTDHEIPAILEAVKAAGALAAGFVLLRLPGAVKPVFLEWLGRTQPEKAKILARIRATRDGQLYQNAYGTRMRGTGAIADQIRQTFELFARKHGLDRRPPPLDTTQFRRVHANGQQTLFD